MHGMLCKNVVLAVTLATGIDKRQVSDFASLMPAVCIYTHS